MEHGLQLGMPRPAMLKRRSICDESEEVPGTEFHVRPRRLKLRRGGHGEVKDATVKEQALKRDGGAESPVLFFPSSPGCDAMPVPQPARYVAPRRRACAPPEEFKVPEMPSVLAGIAAFHPRPGKAAHTSLHAQHDSAHALPEPELSFDENVESGSPRNGVRHRDPSQGLTVDVTVEPPPTLMSRPSRRQRQASPRSLGTMGLKAPLAKMIEKTPPCPPMDPHDIKAAMEHAKDLFQAYPKSRLVRDIKLHIKAGAIDLPSDVYTRPYTGPGALRQWVPPPLPACVMALCKPSFRKQMPPPSVENLCPLCAAPATNSSPNYVPPCLQLDGPRSASANSSSRLTSLSSRCDSLNSSCEMADDNTSPPMPTLTLTLMEMN